MAVSSLVGGLAGGLTGTLSGAIGGAAANKQAARDRRRVRKGIREGEARTEREVYDVLNSPEYLAARQFALGTFGIDIGAQGAGGTTFGGQTYTTAPTGEALIGPRRQAANSLARQLARAYNAQERLQAGGTLAGVPYDQFEAGQDSPIAGGEQGLQLRDQRILAGVDPLLARAGQLSPEEQRLVNKQFARRAGVTLEQGLHRLGPGATEYDLNGDAVPATGGPVSFDPGSTTNVQTAGAAAAPGVVPGFGVDSPLARDFVRGIQQAQTSRGLYSSQAGAAAEASGLAAFNFQQQKELLPFLMGLSTFGSDYARGARQSNISEAVQRVTGGVAMYGAANPFGNQPVIAAAAAGGLAGAGGGAAVGATLGGGQTVAPAAQAPSSVGAVQALYGPGGPFAGPGYQSYLDQSSYGNPYIV